jgi:hypothetical protein
MFTVSDLALVKFGDLQRKSGMGCIQRSLVLDKRGFKIVVEHMVELKGEILGHLLTKTLTRAIPK